MATTIRRPTDREAAVARSLAVDLLAAEVLPALSEGGVRTLLLKGPSFAGWLYPQGGREYTDLDILVGPDDFERAGAVLARLGFREPLAGMSPVECVTHHDIWVRGGMSIDLHFTFHNVGASPAAFWAEISRETEIAELPRGVAEVPAAHARCALVVLHASVMCVPGSKPLHDLERAVDVVPRSTWSGAAEVARHLDAEEAFVFGLTRIPAGERLARELGLGAPHVTTTFALREAGAPTASLTLERFANSDRRTKVALAFRKVVPTWGYMSGTHGPRRGRILAAYVGRPFNIAWRIGPAYLTWRRAAGSRQG